MAALGINLPNWDICSTAASGQKLAIEREERHLQARFGKTYVDHTERVRRWIYGYVWHHFASSEMIK
jgi:hypothetical protein